MSFTQAISPNPNIPAEEGMCLQYVRQAFGLPARYGSAIEAWNNSPSQHRDRDFPQGVSFPVWWELAGNPYGHVAYVQPDGQVWSTSNLNPNPLKLHPNIEHVEAYYARYGHPLTYLGWTEDVAGYPVITALGGITAQGIINKLEEAGMALEDSDRQFIQKVVQDERATVVAEVRAHTAYWAGEIAKKIVDTGYDIKVFAQASDQQERATVVNEVRAAAQ